MANLEEGDHVFGCDATGEPPGKGGGKSLQPVERNRLARPPQLTGHPGIQKEGIHHAGIGLAAVQIVLGADAHGLPEGDLGSEQVAQPLAALQALAAVQLHDLMPPAGPQGGHLQVTGIGGHQHAENPGVVVPSRREHPRTVLHRQKAR